MKELVSNIVSKKLYEAKRNLDTILKSLVEKKISQMKIRITEEFYNALEEGNVMRMGRTKLVKVRIRKGKVQRRKKFSAVKGYTIRGGKLTRMTPLEKRNRRMAARRAKFKRRSKLKQALRKRTISLRRRRAMGL